MHADHITSIDPSVYPTTITNTGALSVSSGLKTGRVPKEKRVLMDETTKDVRRLIRNIDYRPYGGAPSTCQFHLQDGKETDREQWTTSA